MHIFTFVMLSLGMLGHLIKLGRSRRSQDKDAIPTALISTCLWGAAYVWFGWFSGMIF